MSDSGPLKPEALDENRLSESTPEPPARVVRLGVRLLEAVDGPLREMNRVQGDFVGNIVAAVKSVDLRKVPLVVIRNPKVRETTIRLDEELFNELVAIKLERETSINVLLNTALAHWLEEQKRRRVVEFRGHGDA